MHTKQPKNILDSDIELRFLEREDFENVKDLLSDDEVMKYIGPRRALNDDEIHSWLNDNINEYEYRWNRWAISIRSSNEFIGMVGIKHENGKNDFGYYIRRKYWGSGIAKIGIELALSTLNRLNIPFVIFVNSDNIRSLKLIRSIIKLDGHAKVKNGESGYEFK